MFSWIFTNTPKKEEVISREENLCYHVIHWANSVRKIAGADQPLPGILSRDISEMRLDDLRKCRADDIYNALVDWAVLFPREFNVDADFWKIQTIQGMCNTIISHARFVVKISYAQRSV